MTNKWTQRMLERAAQVALWSKDPDHKVGAVITDHDYHVLGEGYNGPPKNVRDSNLLREKEVLRTVHAEINAILKALMNSKASERNLWMFVHPFSPCASCAGAIINADIQKVIYSENKVLPTWSTSQQEALEMFKEAGVDVYCAKVELPKFHPIIEDGQANYQTKPCPCTATKTGQCGRWCFYFPPVT